MSCRPTHDMMEVVATPRIVCGRQAAVRAYAVLSAERVTAAPAAGCAAQCARPCGCGRRAMPYLPRGVAHPLVQRDENSCV